jgi:hypothetical protein
MSSILSTDRSHNHVTVTLTVWLPQEPAVKVALPVRSRGENVPVSVKTWLKLVPSPSFPNIPKLTLLPAQTKNNPSIQVSHAAAYCQEFVPLFHARLYEPFKAAHRPVKPVTVTVMMVVGGGQFPPLPVPLPLLPLPPLPLPAVQVIGLIPVVQVLLICTTVIVIGHALGKTAMPPLGPNMG